MAAPEDDPIIVAYTQRVFGRGAYYYLREIANPDEFDRKAAELQRRLTAEYGRGTGHKWLKGIR